MVRILGDESGEEVEGLSVDKFLRMLDREVGRVM